MSQLSFSELQKMVSDIEGKTEEEIEDIEYLPITEADTDRDKRDGVDDASSEGIQELEGATTANRGGDERGSVVLYKEEARAGGQTAVEKLDDAIAVIDKLRKYYSKIREAAIGVTQTEDWTNWGGKYRLNESGASKIMSQLGIHEETIESRKVNETWGYTIYITRRYVPSWNTSASFDAVGSCRSDDAFVAVRRVWSKEQNRKVTKVLPAEEVDESNVLKAALANCRVNGVIAVCGIKTVAVAELEEAKYVDISRIEEVSFKGGKGKAKNWKPSDKQIKWITGQYGVTDTDIKACKSYQDFQGLVDKCKAGDYKPVKQEEDDF